LWILQEKRTAATRFHSPPGLDSLSSVTFLEDKFGEWKPVSRVAGIAWLCFYALFLAYAFAAHSGPFLTEQPGFLLLDYVNLIIHEGGHFFFSWFGETMHILGGTLGELIVPFLCALYFFWHRETTGFAFSCFWFFENFPYIGTYMADARAAALPLVGGSDDGDWTILFGQGGNAARGSQDREHHAHARMARDGRDDCMAGVAREAGRGDKGEAPFLVILQTSFSRANRISSLHFLW
jgi:hypothetical protein